ncbi:MAG: FHA domain-containing protein [Myxococcales bacterium]|nr:FHA domain-containing protein [Myxococcales bacterium]
MRFRLKYLRHDLELSPGTFAIGRSAECQLSLDDPLVSRKHASLLVDEDFVWVEDAGSRNGVLVNGIRIDRRTRLDDGDRITIGQQEMVLSAVTANDGRPKPLASQGHATLVTMPVATRPTPFAGQIESPLQPLQPAEEHTIERPRRGEALKLLGGVAEKALALNNPDGAERLLTNGLLEIHTDLRSGKQVPADSIDLAARFAARLAAGTGKGTWGDYTIELYALSGSIPPPAVVDELYAAAHKMRGFDLTRFRAYLTAVLRREALSPTERFVVQRLESLERLLASR